MASEYQENWKDKILPNYFKIFRGLIRRYDQSSAEYGHADRPFCVERTEYSRHECRGGYNFASALDITVERTKDTKAVKSIWKALYTIAAYHPSAGSVSWEMRRFIRRATTEEIIEFGDILREYSKVKPDFMLDMDGLFWDTSYANSSSGSTRQKVLDDIKQSIEMEKNPSTYAEV